MPTRTIKDVIQENCIKKIDFSSIRVNHNGKELNAKITMPRLLNYQYGSYGHPYNFELTIECRIEKLGGPDSCDIKSTITDGTFICSIEIENDEHGIPKDIESIAIKDNTLFIKSLL